ncbi:MAG: ABC transporter permease [Lachnospiraceae bacterium]|nr:ABC transporter permease [Lachnospiraceae bacterium]
MKYLKKNKSLLIGLIITGIVLALALIGLFWTPYSTTEMSTTYKLSPPSAAHWFGTDNYGRDIFSRIMQGMGTTFIVSITTVVFGMIVGTVIGMVAGYVGGWFDEVIMRINDVLNAFPSVLLALVFVSFMGTGLLNIILALGILFIPSFARIARSEMLRLKSLQFVQSAQLSKAKHARIIFAHILPNALATIFASAAVGFNNAVLAEASLSYLGLGVQPPTASLGRMISEAGSYLVQAPWFAIAPGVAIIILVMGITLISEGLTKIEQ